MPGAAISCISACLWLAAELLGEKQYSETWIPGWNASIRFSTFLITALLVAHVQPLLARETNLAETDALTGSMNRRSFIIELDAELRRSARYRLPMSLAFIDIDNFKMVNDTLGHQAGDDVLQLVAEIMRHRLRHTDIMGRLGGDEFVVLLPQTEIMQSEAAMKDLLDEIAAAAAEQAWPIMYSVGVVSVDIPCESGTALLGESDRLMYEVKKGGKNSMLHRSLAELAKIT